MEVAKKGHLYWRKLDDLFIDGAEKKPLNADVAVNYSNSQYLCPVHLRHF